MQPLRATGRRLRLLAVLLVTTAIAGPLGFGCRKAPTLDFPESDLPRWRAQLCNPAPEKRTEAISTLIYCYSRRHSEVVADAVRLLADPDPGVRAWAADGFGAFSRRAMQLAVLRREARPALVGVLHDPDTHVRQSAIESLGLSVDSLSSEVPALAVCLGDKDATVRWVATRAISYLANRDRHDGGNSGAGGDPWRL